MGLTLRKTKYDEQYDAIVVPVEESIPAPLGGTVLYPPRTIRLPRIGLGILGDYLSALSFSMKRGLACLLLLSVVGSICTVTHLWSFHSKADLETARTEYRSLEGRFSELSGIVPRFAQSEYEIPGEAN